MNSDKKMYKLMVAYERKYNYPKSDIKVDASWQRFKNLGEENISVQRYKYSIDRLFGNVLDVGCGDGYGISLMLENKNINFITGLEVQDKSLELCEKNIDSDRVDIFQGIGENMPFGDKVFDSTFCGQTLEHVEDARMVLEEIKRVTKTRLVVSVPIRGGIHKEHIREFANDEEFIALISEYFTVIDKKAFEREDGTRILVLIAEL